MLAALYALADEGVPFRVALAGENFRVQPAEFTEARERLGARLVHFGYAESEAAYARLLWDADVVLSTAMHEFFGVSVVEAIYCGAAPVLPNRLSYPELIPPELHAACLYDDFAGLLARLKAFLTREAPTPELRPALARFDWSVWGRSTMTCWRTWQKTEAELRRRRRDSTANQDHAGRPGRAWAADASRRARPGWSLAAGALVAGHSGAAGCVFLGLFGTLGLMGAHRLFLRHTKGLPVGGPWLSVMICADPVFAYSPPTSECSLPTTRSSVSDRVINRLRGFTAHSQARIWG